MIENRRERNFMPRIQQLIFGSRMGFYRTNNGSFILPKTTGIHSTFITKILGDTLLSNDNASRITLHRTDFDRD